MVQHARNPGKAAEEVPDGRLVARVIDINVSDLMVADGKGPAGEGVEALTKRPKPHRDQTCLPQRPVRLNRAAHGNVPVFAYNPDSRADRLGGVQEWSACSVQFSNQPGHIAAV